MKKAFAPLFVILISLLMTPTVSGVSETESGILYSIKDGYVTIEGYKAVGPTVMTIPDELENLPVRYIADYACRNSTYITAVVIPGTVKEIGEYAFADCPNLLRVSIGDGLETIGFSAFSGNAAMLGANLPGTLKEIEPYAFYGCTMLGKMKIPPTVEKIGVDAFMGCERLVLDVSENAAASEYAKQYSIPVGFTSTWTYKMLMSALFTAILGAGFWVALNILKKIKKKTP